MCGRLSQYRGIHDFVAALSIPNALLNYADDQPFERYNATPTTQLALFHQEGEYLRADMVRWGRRPHWAKDRAAPINARVEKVAHGPFLQSHLATPGDHCDRQLV
jgi:putative SOS response-associated peptidase YedK